ncbi:hypothetical protein BHYA_0002g00690 [Botrytis hyacinthi]|uniref:Glucose 2-oxidase n=1 Tax=Botrytis hyacinthi TaxID=278943 RepID=A0A4Z1H215_9HELO|nr:hypothetical protein BHYA_0002g00690 [Botrytis hyacinthi]
MGSVDVHTEMERQNSQHYDVLIVGSGPIGAVYARTLIDANKGISVLMVEVGDQRSKLIGDHHKNNAVVQKDISRFGSTVHGVSHLLSEPPDAATQPLDPDSLAYLRSGFVWKNQNAKQLLHNNLPAAPAIREVGGMGAYWSCVTPEQHPEIERSDIFSHEEWKILYDRARALFNTTDTAFDGSIRQQLIKNTLRRANGNRKFVSLPLACQRSKQNPDYIKWTSTASILGDLAEPKYDGRDFELKAQHCCTRLIIDADSKQVVGAELKNLVTNEVVIAKAKKYVVCAGATLSTGILFNSGIRPDTGYRALGRYLTEQTMAWCQVVIQKSLVESIWDNPRCKEHSKNFPQDPLRIPFNDPYPMITTPISKEYPWHTQIQRDPFRVSPVPNSIDPRLIVDLQFFSYVEPTYDSRVEFSSDNLDVFGMPRPVFQYQIGEDDAARARDMMKDMVKLALDIGDFVPGCEPKYLPPGAAQHICGITRAGKKDDGTSVVDRHSKVWRLDNLFVGGCSVIPSANACNPTLTAACFAIVGAEKIVQELSGVEC